METLVEMRNITKKFGDFVANDRVNLEVKKGEIHGLLGENGAGKTTLMNILYGIYQPDEGEIIFEGRKVRFRSPKEAISAGIGMVHQHFKLVPKMSVMQNLVLGYRTPSDPLISKRWVREKVGELTEKYGIEIPLDEITANLSVGEEQRVEILKALFRDVKLLILDEPTAVLTPQEVESFFITLKKMARKGLTIIFITHKLKEALKVTDRITVLRRGKNVGTVNTAETDEKELARMMVGREVLFDFSKPSVSGKEVLRVENLWVKNSRGGYAVRGLSFSIREGEIFGIAGVSGNGQKELEEAIAGLRKVERGRILLDGRDLTNLEVSKREGVAYIPEDRIGVGAVLKMTVLENLMLKDFGKYCKKFSLEFKSMEKRAVELVEEFDIRIPSLDSPVYTLSGGNIQRLIIARELSRNPRLIVASQPTRGLDVAGTDYVRKRLVKAALNGSAILLISEDLEEIFQLSDVIAVMYEGEFRGVLRRENADYEKIGHLMAGGVEA